MSLLKTFRLDILFIVSLCNRMDAYTTISEGDYHAQGDNRGRDDRSRRPGGNRSGPGRALLGADECAGAERPVLETAGRPHRWCECRHVGLLGSVPGEGERHCG